MGWRSFLFAFAVLVACAISAFAGPAWAGDAVPTDTRQITAVQLPVRLAQASTQDTSQDAKAGPRYSVQLPPDTPMSGDPGTTAAEPAAAPTTPVTVAPADKASAAPARLTQQPQQPQQQAAPQASETPRYAAQSDVERITVSALRQSEDGLYRLGPGDKLHVIIFGESDLTGDFTIDGQGFVRLPLVGQIQAAGLTSFGLESRIGESLINGGFLVSPKVSVEITGYRPFYILGEVSKPGEYPYVNAMSAPNAIALAGGYTDRAVHSSLYIRHQGEAKEREYPADETTRIYPGDVVRVERSTYWAIMTILSPIISPFATVAYLLK